MTRIPRIMIAAGASGSGKTFITCGILKAFQNRKLKAVSFKCGPDYIDPMFHEAVLGRKSTNLDTYFFDEKTTHLLLEKNGCGNDIAVLEGVMGYYDGVGGISIKGSACDVAEVTDTPVILVINCRGASLSLIPMILGLKNYRADSKVAGVILNQMQPMLYERMKNQIEQETGITVYGYVPRMEECVFESRYLGLLMPDEIAGLKEKLESAARMFEKTLDLDGILNLGRGAPDLKTYDTAPHFRYDGLRIGVARDEAFCFIYEDNLKLLEEWGVTLVPFSPVHDEKMPENLHGVLLYGGYPELYARKLAENTRMRREIYSALSGGMPCMAECGGFMYLQESIEDKSGEEYPMTGVLKGKSYDAGRLKRFGYITLCGGTVFGEETGEIPAHEFHYYDSTECGTDFTARKPLSERKWDCMVSTDSILAGFPHIHYYSNKKTAEAFLNACTAFAKSNEI